MLESPKYSFLQFSLINPFEEDVDAPSQLYFQVGDVLKFQGIFKNTEFSLFPTAFFFDGNNAQSFTEQEYTENNGIYNFQLTIPNTLKGCFCFRFRSIFSDAFVYHYSQKFEIITSDYPISKYTELISYNNDEDSFGFFYENEFENQIRLPINLHSPQSKKDEEIYVKSNGDRVKLKSILEKEYEFETIGNEYFHDCMTVLLMSEFVRVVIGNKTGKYLNEEDYEIDWEDVDKRRFNILVKAKTKIFLDELNVRNPLYGVELTDLISVSNSNPTFDSNPNGSVSGVSGGGLGNSNPTFDSNPNGSVSGVSGGGLGNSNPTFDSNPNGSVSGVSGGGLGNNSLRGSELRFSDIFIRDDRTNNGSS